MVNGEPHNVECLIAASNGCQLSFGAPTKDAMNGEIKLTQGVNVNVNVNEIMGDEIMGDENKNIQQ